MRPLTVSLLFLLAGAARADQPRLTRFAPPAGRQRGAVDQDWTSFLGPGHDAVSGETLLARRWPDAGPRKVWSYRKGSGYTSPAIRGDRLVLFHRVGNEEELVCLDAVTGRHRWRTRWPTRYRDRFNYGNGPRASPVIDAERVYALGAEGVLVCHELTGGKQLWRRDLRRDYRARAEFFGFAATPLILGARLIVNVGAPGGPCVVGLDKLTGEQLWQAGGRWGRSYASPVPATIHGKLRVLVFAGGESDPPHGGLLCIDPSNGKIDFRFPWRSKHHASVNAANPVVIGNRVFITASYETGGAMLEISTDFKPRLLWSSKRFGAHWATPIHRDGHLYGFDGRHMKNAALVCFEVRTGKELWRRRLRWQVKQAGRLVSRGLYRGNLLWVDGQFLCLGERGDLVRLALGRQGPRVLQRAALFDAPETWSVPVISRGLLYVSQHHAGSTGGPTLTCLDLRR